MAKLSHMVLPVTDVGKSRDWYVKNLDFKLEFEREGVAAIKDEADLTIFLQKAENVPTGGKITLTIQVKDVDRKHQELASGGAKFASAPKRQFWGYGAEVLDPDGYMNHLWDEATMLRAVSEKT